MVGSAGERDPAARHVQDPAREIGAGRHQKRGVIKARLPRIIWFGIRPMREVHDRHGACAEHCLIRALFEHGEPDHIAIKSGDTIQIPNR